MNFPTAYAKIIIDVFLRPEFYHGSMHLYDYMMNAKNCLDAYDTEYFDHLKQYFIIHNGFWFHPENVLICAAVNPTTPPQIRRKATNILLKIQPNYEEIFYSYLTLLCSFIKSWDISLYFSGLSRIYVLALSGKKILANALVCCSESFLRNDV